MTTQQRRELLEHRAAHQTARCPLREKVAVRNEIRELLSQEWIEYNRNGGKLTWSEYKANAGY